MPSSPRPLPRWSSLFFLAFGIYLVLVSLGLVPYTPSMARRAMSESPPHWPIAGFGMAFFCAGVSVAFGDRRHGLLVLNGAVLLASFFSAMGWFLFFSGRVDLPFQIIGGLVMAMGGAGAVFGLVRAAQGKPPTQASAPADPLHEAEIYLAYGRKAQARALLVEAMQRDPSRAMEFQKKLNDIG